MDIENIKTPESATVSEEHPAEEMFTMTETVKGEKRKVTFTLSREPNTDEELDVIVQQLEKVVKDVFFADGKKKDAQTGEEENKNEKNACITFKVIFKENSSPE